MMLEESSGEYDPETEIFTDVSVSNPAVTKNGFTYMLTFNINLESNDPSFTFQKSTVKRSLSDFYDLRSLLCIQHPLVASPSLPSKSMSLLRPSADFVETRRKGVENFLKSVLRIPVYLSNKALHLFLQSMLPMSIVMPLVTGKTPKKEDMDKCSVDGEALNNISKNRTVYSNEHFQSPCGWQQQSSIEDCSRTTSITPPSPSMRCAKDRDSARKYVQVCVPTLHSPASEPILPRCSSTASGMDSQYHSSVDSGVNSGSFPGALHSQSTTSLNQLHADLDNSGAENRMQLSEDRDIRTLSDSEESLLGKDIISIEDDGPSIKVQQIIAKDEGIADLH